MTPKDDLVNRCRELFLNCSEFEDQHVLSAFFHSNAALNGFADGLPEANSKSARVTVTLAYLLRRNSLYGEPALILFLDALCGHRSRGDAQKQEIAQLLASLTAELKSVKLVSIHPSSPLQESAEIPALATTNEFPDKLSFADTASNQPPPPEPVGIRIFLSYARADKEAVGELYRKLREAGFDPWMDVENILPGESWEVGIKKAIRSSDFFLACLSPRSVNRRGVLQKEIKRALDRLEEMIESDIYLIPARLEDSAIPDELSHLQCVDLFKPEAWDKLLQAIREGVKRRTQ